MAQSNQLPSSIGMYNDVTWDGAQDEERIELIFNEIDCNFLDTVFEQRYQSEEKLRKLFVYFTVLAIFIGCLGLFGLASFAAEQRTKEIGIRKILGASDSLIIVLLSKEFTRLVLLASVIAMPLAYLAMRLWLGGFAYRININNHIVLFLGAAFAALAIAWITISFQAVKAARSNPVDLLRYE